MNKKALASLVGLLRAGALAAIMLMELALSSHFALAQATYNYGGRRYSVATPPYTSSMSVSGTLQFWSYLPPNQTCIDPTTIPGFRLVLRDGVEGLDTSGTFPLDIGVIARVSTDSHGQITQPWTLALYLKGGFVAITSDAVPAGSPASCFVPGGPTAPSTGDTAEHDIPVTDTMNFADTAIAGNWSYPSASGLAATLTNAVDLQLVAPTTSLSDELKQIAIDIADNNGNACSDLTTFANVVKTHPQKTINDDALPFIARTVAIMQSQLHCHS